jgi:hypothetical protein
MQLTRTETNVVSRLRSKRVATMDFLCQQLRVSHMSVVRALKKYGYFTSINHNAAYYTLHDIPRFDDDGLWSYRNICFSSHRTLAKTLVALVQNAPAGLSVAQLQQRLNTKVGNLLSRLCQENELTRCFLGRQAVYLAVEPQRQQRQRQELERQQPQQQSPATTTALGETDSPSFPPRCDVVLVLEVLIQIIKAPTADAAGLAQAIRARGVQINARQVQRVIDFYSLQKKRNPRRG